MSENQVRKLCNLNVPVPMKVGNRFYLCGNGGNVEVNGPIVNRDNRIDRNKVRTYIRKQAKVILGTCDNVDTSIEDLNPRLYSAWWGD
jgi:hypothetical protein